jgi:hypothetical protein
VPVVFRVVLWQFLSSYFLVKVVVCECVCVCVWFACLPQMWSSVLPLDVAKTRIQTAQPGSSWDTSVAKQLVMMWREGGRHSLWAGLAPTLVRAFPANACQWLAWELAMRQLLPPAAPPEAGSGTGTRDAQHQQLLAQGPAATAAAA